MLTRPEPKVPFWSSHFRQRQVAIDLKGKGIRSTLFNSTGQKYLFSVSNNQFIVSYKYPQFMLRLNSNNQIVLLYYYDNKKQPTIVLYSCHLNATVNHLRSTSTYTSYFTLLLLVTKYYKSAVHVGGDSVKSDQTFMSPFVCISVVVSPHVSLFLFRVSFCLFFLHLLFFLSFHSYFSTMVTFFLSSIS